jgi:SNF2 family DNA or RNA helicase
MSMLYLYYSLEITPNNIGAGIIKKNLNLKEIATNLNTLKNDAVEIHYSNVKKIYCPKFYNEFINMCYSEFEIDGYQVLILFAEVLNSELLTPTIIFNNESRVLETLFDRHIKIHNNLLSQHDFYYNYELDLIMKNISSNIIYDLKPLSSEGTIKTVLYNYQKDNINWMLKLESESLYYNISDDRKFYFPDGRIFNYVKRCFESQSDPILIRGGILMDDVGIGKTLQMLTLCCETPQLESLIIVPDHLVDHWENQINFHFDFKPTFITISSFSSAKSFLEGKKYGRLIVDEIHELYTKVANKDIFSYLVKYESNHKWGISATPVSDKGCLFNILKYLSCKEWSYSNMERFHNNNSIYNRVFRKKLLSNISTEIQLPDINLANSMITFNRHELDIYNAELEANQSRDEVTLRKICCDVTMNYKPSEYITLGDFNNIVLKQFYQKYELAVADFEISRRQYDNCVEAYNANPTEENNNNMNHFLRVMQNNQQITSDRFRAYDYLKKQVESTDDCPICSEPLKDGVYDVLECRHIYCVPCLESWSKNHNKCPMCRLDIVKSYRISNTNEIRIKHSSKIQRMIDICKKTDEKIIIFTQYPEMIEKIEHSLNVEEISNIKFESYNDISRFRNEYQVLILSSDKNASGLDLSDVRNIIIFEPFMGTYSFMKDVEKQLIGRIYRINQTRIINVHRLIISNTLEEEIYA